MSTQSLFNCANAGGQAASKQNSASTFPNIPSGRRESLSARWERRYWAAAETETKASKAEKRTILQVLLPEALTNYRVSATNNPLLDAALIFCSFAATVRLGTFFLSVLWPGLHEVTRSLLCSASLGPPFIFASLIVLLNCCEGVYSGKICSLPLMRKSLAKSVIWAALIVGISFYSQKQRDMQAGFFVLGGSSSYLALWAWRNWRSHKVLERRPKRQGGKRRVVIVGAGKLGQELAHVLSTHYDSDRTLVGFLDDTQVASDKILGCPEELTAIARAYFVDEVILARPHPPELATRIVREARRCGLDVRTAPELFGEGSIEYLGRMPLLTLHAEPAPAFAPRVKRAFDVIASVVALLLTAPLMAVIAMAIKLDSPGPAFYRAPRAGKKGKAFLCLKFRTMIADADNLKENLRLHNERCGVFFKMADDPRITRLGGFLRRYSLDELPQFWNVLHGDMSVVGPRPHPLDDCRRYQLEYLRRLDVRPGITGLWQVTARRDPSFGRGLSLDLHYIEHWNLWMDLRILLKTAGAVLQGNGE